MVPCPGKKDLPISVWRTKGAGSPKKDCLLSGTVFTGSIRTGAGIKAGADWGWPLSNGLSSFTAGVSPSAAMKGKVRSSVFFCPWHGRKKNDPPIDDYPVTRV